MMQPEQEPETHPVMMEHTMQAFPEYDDEDEGDTSVPDDYYVCIWADEEDNVLLGYFSGDPLQIQNPRTTYCGKMTGRKVERRHYKKLLIDKNTPDVLLSSNQVEADRYICVACRDLYAEARYGTGA